MGVCLEVCSVEGRPPTQAIRYELGQTRIVIGRGAGADVRIPDLTVSEHHATLSLEGDQWLLQDQGSTNGTFIDGESLPSGRRRRLADGARIACGAYELSFRRAVVTAPGTAERTSELARRLFRESRRGRSVGAPRLVVITGRMSGHSLDVPAPPVRLIVGRDESCQLTLDDPDISREHFELVRDLDGVQARDLGSKNGLLIGERSVRERRLRDGDEVTIGSTTLLYEEPAEEPMRSLTTEADLRVPATELPTGKPYEPEPQAPGETVPMLDPPARSTQPKARRGAPSLDADLIIYVLAAVIFAVSVGGLLILMR